VLNDTVCPAGRRHARRGRATAAATLAAAVLCLVSRGDAVTVPIPGGGPRLEVSGFLDGLAIADTEGGPRQRPQALSEVRVDGDLTRRLHGRLTVRGRAGGPFEGGHPGIYDLVHVFQNHTPSLELNEAYLELRLARADVRAGVQKFAWGRLDGAPPTDVINPRDFHDPIVRDTEESKIGVPALAGTWYAPDVPAIELSGLRVALAYVPIAVPPRLALVEERWFPEQTRPRGSIRVPRAQAQRFLREGLGIANLRLARDLVIPVDFRTLNRRPPFTLDAGGLGLRLSGTWRATEWDLYHYSGPETAPNADLLATLRLERYDVDTTTGLVDVRLRSRAFLAQTHDTIHMTGAGGATVLGPLTLRVEAAFFQDRAYVRSAGALVSPEALGDLPLDRILPRLLERGRVQVPLGDLFVERDSVEWGAGVDYLVGGWAPILQVNQIVLLEPAPPLLIGDPDTRVLGILRRWFLNERLETELRGLYTIERGGWFVFPRVSYLVRDDVRVRLGYLAIGGSRRSIIGQFGRNDEVVMQLRYHF
jgi:hypothetical protein